MSFLGELKRRKILQVAAVYAVVAWLLIQIVATIEEPLNLPDWVDTLVIVLLAVGFPITLITSWGFNVTAEGLVRDPGQDAPVKSDGKKIEYALIGLLVIAMLWVIYRVEFDGSETVAETSVAGEAVQAEPAAEVFFDVLPNSIAVLPCANLSLEAKDAFFAAGIHESTLNQLTKIRDLFVIARTSVLQYDGNPRPIPEIAEALKVETVMECSVRYASGRVRITAQLIDGQTGGHLWSEEYDRELTDIFAVQGDVAEHIAAALQAQLLPEEQARIVNRPTESAEAYQHFLRAISFDDYTANPDLLAPYIDSLELAIDADPSFAEAYVELAYGYNRRRDRDLAMEYAKKAIDLDPTYGRAYQLLGSLNYTYYSKLDAANGAVKRAIELDPNDPSVLGFTGRFLAYRSGEYTEGIRLYKRAIAVDPTTPWRHYWLAELLVMAGDLKEAAHHANEAISLAPGNPNNYWMLANVEFLSGNHKAAKEHLDYAVKIAPSSYRERYGYMAHLYGLLGETEQAERLTERLIRLVANPERENWRYLRWASLGTRDKNKALQEWTLLVDGYLEQNERVTLGTIARFRENWLRDPLLEEPEFLQLRRRLGFQE